MSSKRCLGELICSPLLQRHVMGTPFAPIGVLRPPPAGAELGVLGGTPEPGLGLGDTVTNFGCLPSQPSPRTTVPSLLPGCFSRTKMLQQPGGIYSPRCPEPAVPPGISPVCPQRGQQVGFPVTAKLSLLNPKQTAYYLLQRSRGPGAHPLPPCQAFLLCLQGSSWFWRGLWRKSGSQPPVGWLLALQGPKGAHLGAQPGAKRRSQVKPGCKSSAQRPETATPRVHPDDGVGPTAVTCWHGHRPAGLGTVWVTRGSSAGAGRRWCQGIFWAPWAGHILFP